MIITIGCGARGSVKGGAAVGRGYLLRRLGARKGGGEPGEYKGGGQQQLRQQPLCPRIYLFNTSKSEHDKTRLYLRWCCNKRTTRNTTAAPTSDESHGLQVSVHPFSTCAPTLGVVDAVNCCRLNWSMTRDVLGSLNREPDADTGAEPLSFSGA